MAEEFRGHLGLYTERSQHQDGPSPTLEKEAPSGWGVRRGACGGSGHRLGPKAAP